MPCIKRRECKKAGRGIKEKIKNTGRKREENKILYLAKGEGEEYMSEGEDGRPCIKWRRELSTKPTGEEGDTVEKIKEAQSRSRSKNRNGKFERHRNGIVDLGISEEQ